MFLAIDCVHDTKNQPYNIAKYASQPLSYVVSWDNSKHIN